MPEPGEQPPPVALATTAREHGPTGRLLTQHILRGRRQPTDPLRIGEEAGATLKRDAKSEDPASQDKPDLKTKTIGNDTLAESAGARAKTALGALHPGCRAVVNADLVATAQIANLARTADVFVFARQGNSHQAFCCVKDALGGNAPIWAPGKGTGSIQRAIFDRLS